MADDDPLGEFRLWLLEHRAEIDLTNHIAITKRRSAEGERTSVGIDHLVSCPLQGREGWRITTKRTYLPPGHFHSSVAYTLKTAADHGRGRTIYCMDRGFEDEVVAALSYHLDERHRWPPFVTAIGFRTDFPDNAMLRRRTLEAAFLLKQYVHAIAAVTGRDRDVYADVPPNSVTRYAEELGFQKAARLKGLRPSGTLMRQARLGD